MAGDLFLASLNKSLTLAAPRPPIISTNSDPFIDKNGTLDSLATAFANIVLPHPGGPNIMAPLGGLAPNSLYFFGFFK